MAIAAHGISVTLAAQRKRLSHGAVRLLRAENAALILTFAQHAFSEATEIPMAEARAVVDQCLRAWVGYGKETETRSAVYLRQWIDDGYFREHEGLLNCTDTLQQGIRFTEGLDRRELAGTASHLMVVQKTVADLVFDLSESTEARVQMLNARRHQIDQEIAEILQTGYQGLPEAAAAERLREVLRLSRDLTGDFRLVEDEMRRIDRGLRLDIQAATKTKGEVLESLLGGEGVLQRSPAGRAFIGFHELLADPVRSDEFRAHLKSLTDHRAAVDLTDEERGFLRGLLAALNGQGRRVLKRRSQTDEGLNAYLNSKQRDDDADVGELLKDLFRVAAQLHRVPEFDPRQTMPIWMVSGSVAMASPCALRPEQPQAESEAAALEPPASDEIPEEILQSLRRVRIADVIRRVSSRVAQADVPMTIGMVAAHEPIDEGIEEVVALLRVAIAFEASSEHGTEAVDFEERDGVAGRATLPRMIINPNHLPNRPEDLEL